MNEYSRSEILQTYLRRTTRSAAAYQAMLRCVAGGNSRQAGYWPPHPLTVTRGQGAVITDLDGNEYIDCLNNYTALVHGHAYGPIVERVLRQVPMGTC